MWFIYVDLSHKPMNDLKIKTKLVIAVFALVFGVLVFGSNDHVIRTVKSFAQGPVASVTGAPGETNCTSCHSQVSSSGQFTITGPTGYIPGQTYQIQVRHTTTDSTRKRWGFELTSLANNVAAGSFTSLSNTTQTISGNGRLYIEHTLVGTFNNQTGGALWTFNWTAPATDVGVVTFYAAGNQANGDGTSDGDRIYLATAASQPPARNVSVGGRVLTLDGRGVRNAIVTLTDPQGSTRSAMTDPYGSYLFDNVLTGQTYVIGATSRRFQFTSRNVTVSDNLTNVDLIAQ